MGTRENGGAEDSTAEPVVSSQPARPPEQKLPCPAFYFKKSIEQNNLHTD